MLQALEVDPRPRAAAIEIRPSYLLFDIGSETFAVSVSKVNEIIELAELTRVPALPPCVRGMMNLRGTVLPVVDLAQKFGVPPNGTSKRPCVVVIEVEHDGAATLLGLQTDMVHDVIGIAPSEIEPPPLFGSVVNLAYLEGMFRRGERFVLLMNTDYVLSVEELLGTREESYRFVQR